MQAPHPNESDYRLLPPLLALPSDLLQLVILELPSGTDVKAASRTCHALHALVDSGGMELVAAWLWKQHGNQALIKAQQHSDVPMLRQLLELHHADANFIHEGATILSRACRKGQHEVVKFLLALPGMQVNQSYDGACSALHLACCWGHESEVRELLKHPSLNVNEVNRGGNTALHWAALRNQIAAAAALLGHPGVNVHIKNKDGNPALAVAQWQRHSEMVDLLTAHIEATGHRTLAE